MDPECDIFKANKEEEKLEVLRKFKRTMPLKRFVEAKGEDDANIASTSNNNNKSIKLSLCGSNVKNSYLNIVGSGALQSRSKISNDVRNSEMESKKKKGNTVVNMNVNDVMKTVEANDVKKVSEFISADKAFVLNMKDLYGWSALMNACCAGAVKVVELLLKHKPNLNVMDKKGNTCLSLARSKVHKHIVELLQDHINKSSDIYDVVEDKVDTTVPDSFYCEVCKETISKTSGSHFTSTVHLFNSYKKSGIPTSYGIPENNVGFQMLLKTGWNREEGLGPEGSGHKFPPKTVLKQDRAGLGAKKYVSRVTHDPDLVVRDRSERKQTLNRRERLRNELKSKRKERHLREMLS